MLQVSISTNNHLSTNIEQMSSLDSSSFIDSSFIDSSFMHPMAGSPVAQSNYYNNLSTLNPINSASNSSTINMIGSSLNTTSNCALPGYSSLYRDNATYASYTGKKLF